jgi:hypothetical protein
MKRINQLLDVPSTDPDDARRRKLLNILLSGVATLTLLLLLVLIVFVIAGLKWEKERLPTLIIACIGVLSGLAVIFAINRYGAGWLAASLFLLLLTSFDICFRFR